MSETLATQGGVFAICLAVAFYLLKRSDERDAEQAKRADERAATVSAIAASEVAAIRADLDRERIAHSQTRSEVARLTAECAAIRERSEKCEADHQHTIAILDDLRERMDLLMTPKPRTPRKPKGTQ